MFGASNRHSSIVPAPGHYGSVELSSGRDYISTSGISASANGYSVSSVPFSYFVGYDRAEGRSRINDIGADGTMSARGDNLVLGAGLRPSHALGLFAFANVSSFDGHFSDRASGLTDDQFALDSRRFDLGAHYRFSPASQAWLKLGTGWGAQPVAGALFSPESAAALDAALAPLVFSPSGRLTAFEPRLSQDDLQFRHSFDATARTQVSWGLESGREKRPFRLAFEFLPARFVLSQDNRVASKDAWVSARTRLAGGLEAQAELHYQDTKLGFLTDETLSIGAASGAVRLAGDSRRREWNPRLGLRWRGDAQTLRVAAQAWRRPAGVNTLAPIDTVGIPLDDRLVQQGGLFRRARVQHELELGRGTFVQWFLDRKSVRNPDDPGASLIPAIELEQLARLLARKRVYALPQEFLEATPKFGSGVVRQAGVAANHLVTGAWSVSARYIRSSTRSTSAGLEGNALPYHPRHYLGLVSTWQPRARWIVSVSATYRSRRFADEANAAALESGWQLGAGVYWESEDKRLALGATIDHVRSRANTSIYARPTGLAQAIYRF